MPRIKPIVTYSLAAVIIIWVMLGAITLPNATHWFRGSGYSIRQGKQKSTPLNAHLLNALSRCCIVSSQQIVDGARRYSSKVCSERVQGGHFFDR